MTCRHQEDDPSCGSYAARKERKEKAFQEELQKRGYTTVVGGTTVRVNPQTPQTPDSEKYEIVDVVRVGRHVVMKVLYPNCRKCSYEGNKIMVFLNVTEVEILKWRKIDPHFRGIEKAGEVDLRSAPSPAARFPASSAGWADAIAYAHGKVKVYEEGDSRDGYT